MTVLTSLRKSTCVLMLLSLGACSTAPSDIGYNDPYEPTNRKIHAFNKAIDQGLISPASDGYGAVFNEDLDLALSNFVENLSLPSRALNNLLQFDLAGFRDTTTRFILNTTIGFGGIGDVASGAGLENDATDFGETLHVWGVSEGTYLELPILGGSTQRDAFGFLVDFGINPLGQFLTAAESNQLRGAQLLESLGDRHVYGDWIDSVLYSSEDSYATQRQFYLENRRFQLDGSVSVDDLEDPFADE